MAKEKYVYSNKPLVQRLLFLLLGFSNFILGFGLYYLFKDDKSKEWQIEFIQRGSMFGLIFFLIGVIYAIISWIMTGAVPLN